MNLHIEHSVPITYYSACTFGGDVEWERAWVFAEVERRYEHDAETSFGDVLRKALIDHGVSLPSAYFAPHSRSFDWERFRVC